MTSRFVPHPMPPGNGNPRLPIPIQINPNVPQATRAVQSDAERWFGFGTPEGRAWAMLLLRAAYLSDYTLTSTIAGYRDGLVNSFRAEGPALGQWRVSLLEYEPSILCVLHGVRNNLSVQSVALDMLTPRYTAGGTQFLSTAGLVGDALLDILDGGRWSAKDRFAIGHSFGGVIAGYLQAQIPLTHPFRGIQTFGTPKVGQRNAANAVSPDARLCYGAADDPVIGFPPPYIRLPDVAQLIAIWPLAAAAALATKRRLDGIWETLVSLDSTPNAIAADGTLSPMADVDNGRNWYARTPVGIANLFSFNDFHAPTGHMAATYYNRCRAGFDRWTTLNANAGPGGRNADVIALALDAAEVLEG